VGFAVSALLNYGLNYRLAFHSGRPHRSACRALRPALTGLRLNGAIMHGSVHWLSLHYLVAQVTATLLVLFRWNFAVNGMPAVGLHQLSMEIETMAWRASTQVANRSRSSSSHSSVAT